MNNMLLAGANITSTNDELKKVTLDYLYHNLRNPKPSIESRIRQLRIIRDLDPKQYAMLKRQLPYIVCGVFNPPYRTKENFAYIEYFIVDIDHISDKNMNLNAIRSQLENDPRIVMSFVSPSEDGLKLLFHLSERCYDIGLYTLFYKVFIHQFSVDYNLEQVVDTKTSDVSRACFISIDPNVYYNADATPIILSKFIDKNDVSSMFDLKKSIEKDEKTQMKVTEEKADKNPTEEIMQQIKAKLNPNGRTLKKEKTVFVPDRLEEIMENLKGHIEETGVVLYETINIQYGKKLRFKNGILLAEINIFYGKHGFSVIQTPKCGTSSEFNQLMADYISAYISSLE